MIAIVSPINARFSYRTTHCLCTIIVSDSIIILHNASAVENFIPVFFATLLKLAQRLHVDQIALKPRSKMVPKTKKLVNNF
jgi:hypothetical protein